MPDTPRLTACIVTYNSRDHIGNALASLQKSRVAGGLSIIVVDNASKDGTADFVQAEFPFVHLIRLTQNIGFGRGHNQALPFLHSPYHVIVNPDITLRPNVLSDMADFMDARPDVALLSPRVRHTDGSEQFLPKELPSLHFLAGGFLERLGKPFSAWRAKYTWKDRQVAEPVEAPFCTGCFMFVRTAALREVGGFDPRYFLYLEDADLTRELKKKGLTLYHPGFCVTHAWARDSARSLRGALRHIKAAMIYFRKWGLRL